MAKSLVQIQKQIDKLQQEAAAVRAKEVAGVVARIQEAITHYGLTTADLFGKSPKSSAKGPGAKATRVAGKAARNMAGEGKAKPAAKRAAARPPSVIKFRDDAGHSWTGVGKRPRWYLQALEAGKTPEDLMVK